MEIESNSRLGRNMFVACETGDTNKLLECLEIAEPDEVVFENEVTALQVAAANGHVRKHFLEEYSFKSIVNN